MLMRMMMVILVIIVFHITKRGAVVVLTQTHGNGQDPL